MPQHLIEVYAPKGSSALAGERYASIQMPTDSTQKEMTIAAEAAKTAVTQVLGRLGVQLELRAVYIPNSLTDEEMTAIEKGISDGSIPTYTHEEVRGSLESPE